MTTIPTDLKERARWEIDFFERPSVETSKALLQRVEELEAHIEACHIVMRLVENGPDYITAKAEKGLRIARERKPETDLSRVKDLAQADLLNGLLLNHTEFGHPEAGPIVDLMVRLEKALRDSANGE